MRTIYLDYNATTPVAPSVLDAMQPYWSERFGNASSDYSLGNLSRAAISEARTCLAEVLGALPDEIVLTSGGTESNNLALLGATRAAQRLAGRSSGHVIISAVEHPAVVEPARELARYGIELSVCPCDTRGVLDLKALGREFRDDTLLVSVMHANNETGVVQPIVEVGRLCQKRNVLFHCDAAQTLGKIPVSVQELKVDLLSIAGHKLYAPKGIGALYIRTGVPVDRVLLGANQEWGLSPGTESVPLIVGLGKAAHLAAHLKRDKIDAMEGLRNRLLEALREGVPGLILHGEGAERLPNTLSVSFPKCDGRKLLRAIPDLAASTGAACHSSGTVGSATLRAMQVSPEVALGTVRLSLGWPTSTEEVDRAASLLVDAWQNGLGR